MYLSLPERGGRARPFPSVEVVDMREELQTGNRSILSHRLQTALKQMKAEGNQGLLFIHRRGHSSFVACRAVALVDDVSPLRCFPGLSPTPCPQCHDPALPLLRLQPGPLRPQVPGLWIALFKACWQRHPAGGECPGGIVSRPELHPV